MILLNLPDSILTVTFITSLLVLLVSIRITVELADIKLRSYTLAFSLLLFIASFLPVQVLAEIGSGRILLARLFSGVPLYLLAFYLLTLILSEILFTQKILRDRKKQIGKNSIKESLDNLPDGLCFSKPDGTPLLVNRTMQKISYGVFGKWLVNDLACAEAVKENKIKAGASILQRNPLVIGCNHEVWLIQTIDHGPVKETLAYNISLEWTLLREIEKKNQKIKELNNHLKSYQKNVSEYTRQKEILQAKINIHDKIGQSLIYFKHYLEKADKSEEDRTKLIQLWKESLLVLDEQKAAPQMASSWDKLISTARAIGVEIHQEGRLPLDNRDLSILVGIVHEALNNAIRHGEAKNVWIQFKEDSAKNYCKIINDGKTSPGPIQEKGGLKNIRQRLKLHGGNMEILTEPDFQLDLSWPKGGYYGL